MGEECGSCARLRVDLAALRAETAGHWRLDEERFRSRDLAAEEIAKSLREFKVLSNEWRGALADLGSTKADAATVATVRDLMEKKIDTVTYDARHQQLVDQIAILSDAQSQSKGARQALFAAVTVVGILAGIAFALAAKL